MELTDKQIENATGGSNPEVDAEIKELSDELAGLIKLLEETEDESEKDRINQRMDYIKKRIFELLFQKNDGPEMPIEL